MAILPSHRQGMYYLERCRVMAKDEQIVYAMQEDAVTKFFALPRANTNAILLGSGTSITQAAARMLAEDGVMLAFTGGGGAPLYLASQSEYRPTEYLQGWVSFWFDEQQRLSVAKRMQFERVRFLNSSLKVLDGAKPDPTDVRKAIDIFVENIEKATSPSQLLGHEATFAKELYRLWATRLGHGSFIRQPQKQDRTDLFNSYLDHGNYLAYGLAGTVLWVLGIPHSLPVLHGQTRRGALVFDVADIIKDATIMPIAFQCAAESIPDNQMRGRCVAWLDQSGALRKMFEVLTSIITDPK